MCRSNACAAAGGLADRTGRPWRGRRACASTPRLDVRAIPGRAGWTAGQGLAAPRPPPRAGRRPPVATDRGGLLARGVDPLPRRMGAAWHQPSCSPRRRPPAVNIMAAPVPRQCRPASSPWAPHSRSSSAASGPVPAPGTAGRRGCRTAGPGGGTPGSANRRSAGCTDARHRAWPAGAPAALVDPRSGRDADLPGPAHLPAAHQASPPWPVARLRPTSNQARLAGRMARPPYCAAVGLPDKLWGQTTPPTPGGLC
jgi:hypothetical protein